MLLTQSVKQTKLKQLALDYGFDSVNSLLMESATDSVVPAICIECDQSTDMEPDQDEGYCENCGKNTVHSALILAGLI